MSKELAELHILGADPGIENPGLAHIVNERTAAKTWTTRAVEVRSPKLERDNGYNQWGDVTRRSSMLWPILLEMFPIGAPLDIVAIEEYTAFTVGAGRYQHAWKNQVQIGVLQGFALSRGARIIMVNPKEPKKEHSATSKAGVCRALCGHIKGMRELLDEVGNKKHHNSDATAIAYQGMVKSFRSVLTKGRRR